ncbi:hypothetical protein CPC16_004324 [Podila verticillata]|nr:hypothetical protein CPC16_004324 [Podila verticillata]
MLYRNIPIEIRNYIVVDEETFNSYPPQVREILRASAEEQYQNDHEDDDVDEELEDFPIVDFTITVDKKKHLQAGITAGNGEGISRKLSDGYWLLDLFQAKTNCIPNAYTLWTMYKDGSLDDVIQGVEKEFYRRRKGLPHGKNLKFEDIVGDDEFDILYEDESIANITPKDTKNKCYFSYINGHVGVIIHEKYLDEKSVKALVKSTRRTFLHKILPKEPNDKPIKINSEISRVNFLRLRPI